jgi:hypothetical protein
MPEIKTIIDLQPLWDWLKQPANFVIGFNIVIGYMVKKSPWINNKFLETVVFCFSIAVTPFFHQPPIYGFMYGAIYAVVSFKIYDWILRPIENKFKPVEPPSVILPVLCAATMFLTGCATSPTGERVPDPVAIQQGAYVTSYGLTSWALSLSHGDDKDLAEKKEHLAKARQYLVIARDQGQSVAQIALGLAQTLPDKEHWKNYVDGLKTGLQWLSGPELKAALNGLISGIDQATLAFP